MCFVAGPNLAERKDAEAIEIRARVAAAQVNAVSEKDRLIGAKKSVQDKRKKIQFMNPPANSSPRKTTKPVVTSPPILLPDVGSDKPYDLASPALPDLMEIEDDGEHLEE